MMVICEMYNVEWLAGLKVRYDSSRDRRMYMRTILIERELKVAKGNKDHGAVVIRSSR